MKPESDENTAAPANACVAIWEAIIEYVIAHRASLRKALDRTASGQELRQGGMSNSLRSHRALENKATKLLASAQQGLTRVLALQRANTESRSVFNQRDWEAAKKSMSPKQRLWLEDTARGISLPARTQQVESDHPQGVDSYSREIFDSIDQSKPTSAQTALAGTVELLLRDWKADIARIRNNVNALERVDLSIAADSTSAVTARLRTQFATLKKLVSQMFLIQTAFFSALDLERFAKASLAGPTDFEKLRERVLEQTLLTIAERARIYDQSLIYLEDFARKGESEREKSVAKTREQKRKNELG